MKLTYLASLLVLVACPAFSGPITWTPVQSSMPPTVTVQQQPDYAANVGNGLSQMANAMKQYEEGQSRKSVAQPVAEGGKPCVTVDGQVYCKDSTATPQPIVEYLTDQKGRLIKCTYNIENSENSFCESPK